MGTLGRRVAVVDDEDDLREAIVEYLGMNGFEATGYSRPAAFRAAIASQPVDLVVLDIAMPGEDGLSLARWLRANHTVGIIFATAAGTSIDRIVGLELGGDDYLVKPYELRELLARARSVIRRMPERAALPTGTDDAKSSKGSPAARRAIRFGGFLLDLDARSLGRADGSAVDLTAKEFELMEVLATRPGRVLSRAQILELAPGQEGADAARAVDIRVTRLRKKIEPVPDTPRFIRTIRGSGYMFVSD